MSLGSIADMLEYIGNATINKNCYHDDQQSYHVLQNPQHLQFEAVVAGLWHDLILFSFMHELCLEKCPRLQYRCVSFTITAHETILFAVRLLEILECQLFVIWF